MSAKPKIIVLDDDPTGSQTVHSCLLLIDWDVETLRLGLRDNSPIFFVLTNTRSLTPEKAASITHEVCQNLKKAIELEEMKDFLIVSRSDSTLRGHFPVETDVITEELGPFDAVFMIPAFFEGGRITRNSVHYLMVNGIETRVHETEFAKDSVFGYKHSFLPDYIEEKTNGRIEAGSVERILLGDIRYGSLERLLEFTDNQYAVVDGETQGDLDSFAKHALDAVSQGKRFLFRSAASILTSLADLGHQPVAAEEMSKYARGGKPGAVIVGSHVKKTTEQLEHLLEEPNTVSIEIDVSHLLEDSPENRSQILAAILEKARRACDEGKTPVIYTSRDELTFEDAAARLKFGEAVSALLMDVVRGLPADLGFLISKGGITSNDVLSTGLSLKSVRQIGQIIPGCSVVKMEPDHPLFPDLPVVLFPGNVGDSHALASVYKRLSR
ncbi:MAG: four-carbon acid sugar kinase family protein [Microcoleus sp.]